MRRTLQFSFLAVAMAAVTACEPQKVFETENIPTAGIRFINAVPDTGAVDFRPVDIVENSTFYQVAFRGTTLLFYKNARAGARKYKIFMANTDLSLPYEQQQAIARTVVADVDLNLEAGKNYTVILWGYARSGSTPARRVTVMEDAPADPGTQVALRILNTTDAAIDGKHYLSTGTAPATATWAAVPALTASNYVNAATGTYRYNVTPAGGGTALFADATALAGTAAVVGPPGPIDAAPGTTVAGSAVTGIVFPRSVAGSRAPNITTPGIVFVWDRRPPRAPGT